jgi:PadR family transcriptional regulator, regulatory protein PadR
VWGIVALIFNRKEYETGENRHLSRSHESDGSQGPRSARSAPRIWHCRRIEQISGDLLYLDQGTIYPALLSLEQMKWVTSKWGVSDNNRRARYYSITRAGRKQLATETESWRRMSDIMVRFLDPQGEA